MRKLLPIVILAATLAVGTWLGIRQEPVPRVVGPTMKMHFIDVGHGDCILIKSPDGKAMLVDAGDQKAGEMVLDYLRKMRVSRLDIFAMTHPHADHIGGVVKVLDNLNVSRIIDSGYSHGSKLQQQVLEKIEEQRIPYVVGREDQKYRLGKDVSIEILSPKRKLFENTKNDANNNSLVIKVTYGNVSVLLTGDIQREAESALLASRKNIESSILKIAHHGSSDSTSIELLRLVKPGYVVISVGGDNEYGHPHRATLRRLSPERLGAKVFRTDQNGTIVLTTDGIAVVARTEK